MLVQGPETGAQSGRDAPAAEMPVGRDEIDRHGRTEVDDQHVAAGQNRRSTHGSGEPVAPQGIGREVIVDQRHGRPGRELQATADPPPKRSDDPGDLSAGGRDDGLRNRIGPAQLIDDRYGKRFAAPLGDAFAFSHNGALDQRIAYVDDQIHNSRKVL